MVLRNRSLRTAMLGWSVLTVSLLWIAGVVIVTMAYWCDFMAYGEAPSEVARNAGVIGLGPIALLVAMWRSVIAARQVEAAQAEQVAHRWQRAVDDVGSSSVRRRKGGMRLITLIAEAHPEYVEEARVTINSVAFSSNAKTAERQVGADMIERLNHGKDKGLADIDPDR